MNMTKEIKIKNQFQNLHSSTQSEVDWVEIQYVERDICLLYHQLSEYSYIMEDLYYGSVYNLPYWKYLSLDKLDPDQRSFIRTGCLVMIFAMVCEELGSAGNYLHHEKKRYQECRNAIFKLKPESDEESKILSAIKRGFELIDQDEIGSSELYDISTWIHKKVVRSYFINTANDFSSNPYFKDDWKPE